jgi:hypothetical protein
MNKLVRILFASALLVGISGPALAQTRTWVSGVGDDLNPCSRTAPCKTFAGAISKTAANGEISVLDPGGFGAVTITKSITINGTGTLASILAAGTNGVNVNDSASGNPNTIVVLLRDISINGADTGLNGVSFTSGKTVMIDHCWIYGFNGSAAARGINVNLSNNGNLKVINGSVIENIKEDGIHMTTSAGILVAVVDNASIMDIGQDGVEAVSNVRADLIRSNVSVIGVNGVLTSGSNSQINLDDDLIAHCNTTGIKASAGCSIRVSDSAIANNNTGLNANSGTIDSFQGNSLIGNPVSGAFSSTTNKQ